MEKKPDLTLSTFKIVFENQILEIKYDTSFKEYQDQTIDNVIQQVLDKIGPKPATGTSKDYILLCSCGRPFDPNKKLSIAKCSHYTEEDFNEEKNKNEKFLLYKNEKYVRYEEYLSDNEISNFLMKATGAKEAIKLTGLVPRKIENFKISDNLKNRIREFYIKKERGTKILFNHFDLKYDETIYKELLEMGIQSNIAKAALRMKHNKKEEAIILATDASTTWDNKDYLFFDNNEVLSKNDFNIICKELIKKEFPHLDNEEEIESRAKYVINRIKKEISGNIIFEDGNESEESSEEEIENSIESESNSNSNNLDLDFNFGSYNFNA